MLEDELRYAEAFSQAIAEDIRSHPPGSSLVRVVVRWSDAGDPSHFAVHALGVEDQADVDPEDAWHPLEWPNAAEEEERTERLGGHRQLIQAAEALRTRYAEDDAPGGGDQPSPATVEAVRRLPGALREADVPLAPHFAASAGHLERGGCLAVLEEVGSPEAIAALRARDELPDD